MREIRLVSTYLSAAVVFTLLLTNHSIGWLTILRWIVEASFVPFNYLIIFLAVCLDSWDGSYLVDPDPSVASRFPYIIKGTLFLWMRYTEFYLSSPLNDFHTIIFYYFCDTSHIFRAPADHPLRRLLD